MSGSLTIARTSDGVWAAATQYVRKERATGMRDLTESPCTLCTDILGRAVRQMYRADGPSLGCHARPPESLAGAATSTIFESTHASQFISQPSRRMKG